MEWSQPQVQGDLVNPRTGHAGISIDELWYIVGGGDNNNGCPGTLALNMSKLVWSTLTSLKERHPLASEVFVMKLKPRDLSHPKIFRSPAAVAAAAAASVTAAYASAKSEKLEFPQIIDLNFNGVEKSVPLKDINIEINAIKEEKKALESSIVEVRAENSRMKEKIDELKSSHTELSMELQSVQGQLISEISRCFKLEAQIAELQKMLESLQTVENEVQILRRQKSAPERMELSSAQRQGSGGAWRWIAGRTKKSTILELLQYL